METKASACRVLLLIVGGVATAAAVCSQDSDCGGGSMGSCHDGGCECRPPWTGDDCSTSFATALGGLFWAYAFMMLSVFMITGIMLVVLLGMIFWANGVGATVQTTAQSCLLAVCTARVLYFSLDPWQSRGFISIQVNNMIFGIAFPFLLAAFSLIALKFCYVVLSNNVKQKPFPRAVKIFWIMTVVPLFLVEGLVRILWFSNDTFGAVAYRVYIVYVCLFLFLLALGFIVSGGSLAIKLYRGSKSNAVTRKYFIKVVTFTCSTVVLMLGTILFCILVFATNSLHSPVGTLVSHLILHTFEIMLCWSMLLSFRGNTRRETSEIDARIMENAAIELEQAAQMGRPEDKDDQALPWARTGNTTYI